MNTLSRAKPAVPAHHARPAIAAIVGFAAIVPAHT